MVASIIFGALFALCFGKFTGAYQDSGRPLPPEMTEDLPRWLVRLDYIGYFLHSVIPGFCLAVGFTVYSLIRLVHWLQGVAG